MRAQAARELGELRDARAVRYLVARLGDADVTVATAAARALARIGERSAAMPLYELVQNEATPAPARRAAAEALEQLGLFRPVRTGPTGTFMWMLAMTLVVVAVAAASTLGGWAAVAFLAGMAPVTWFVFRELARRRGFEDVWRGPHGEHLHVPEPGGGDRGASDRSSAARRSRRRAGGSPRRAR